MCGMAVTLHRHRTHAGLDGLVAGIVGFDQDEAAPVERRQAAGSLVPLVISVEGGMDVRRDGAPAAERVRSFVAGMSAVPVSTVATPTYRCVQAYLTPIGVRQLLGEEGRDLADRVVALEELAPDLIGPTAERLAEAPDWQTRLAILESALLRRAELGRPADEVVTGAWRQIHRSGGQVRIADVVERSGRSHRHVSARFREQVGLTPKTVSAIVRFERASADLGHAPLSQVAAHHGYADQSHLSRDVARFAGESPTSLRDARRPTAHTALGTAP